MICNINEKRLHLSGAEVPRFGPPSAREGSGPTRCGSPRPQPRGAVAHDDGGREGSRTVKDDTQPRGVTAPASSRSPAAPLATGSSSSRRRRAPGRGERLRMGAPAPLVPLTGARAASRRSSRRGHGQRSAKEQFCWPLGCDEQHHRKRERGVDEKEKMWTRMDGPVSGSCGGE
jgi:hypothetical protein